MSLRLPQVPIRWLGRAVQTGLHQSFVISQLATEALKGLYGLEPCVCEAKSNQIQRTCPLWLPSTRGPKRAYDTGKHNTEHHFNIKPVSASANDVQGHTCMWTILYIYTLHVHSLNDTAKWQIERQLVSFGLYVSHSVVYTVSSVARFSPSELQFLCVGCRAPWGGHVQAQLEWADTECAKKVMPWGHNTPSHLWCHRTQIDREGP